MPEGERNLMLAPGPGVQVCEIAGHGIVGDTISPDNLIKLANS